MIKIKECADPSATTRGRTAKYADFGLMMNARQAR
jgi:hypothetical protein